MARCIHFISGLPRSGSTLLSAILRQNPAFHAGMSGPMGGLFGSLLGEMSARNENSVFIGDSHRQAILRGLIENYYAVETERRVVFDTHRSWCTRMPALAELFPGSKVIACVREVQWIVDSVERLVRRNKLQPSLMFNFQAGGTVYSRADLLAGPDGLVGYAHRAVREAFYGDHPQNLLLLQYETLTSEPARALGAIYDFIGEPSFDHNFKDVHFEDARFDARAGTPGLHSVARQVQHQERPSILPPDLFRRFAGESFWRSPGFIPGKVLVV